LLFVLVSPCNTFAGTTHPRAASARSFRSCGLARSGCARLETRSVTPFLRHRLNDSQCCAARAEMRRAALAAADARVLRRLRWRRSALPESGPLVRFAAPRAARSVSPVTAGSAAERAPPVRAVRAQALRAARCISGESAPVDDSSQASSAGSSEGETACALLACTGRALTRPESQAATREAHSVLMASCLRCGRSLKRSCHQSSARSVVGP
jgi:hypothetical protein